MAERREFEMTEEDLAKIKEAGRPVPYMVVGGIPPSSPQENANRAWAALGARMGFKHMTVQPVSGKSQHFFTAEPTEPAAPVTTVTPAEALAQAFHDHEVDHHGAVDPDPVPSECFADVASRYDTIRKENA